MKSLSIFGLLVTLLLSSCGGNTEAMSNEGVAESRFPNTLARTNALEHKCINEVIRPRLKDQQSLRVLNRSRWNVKAENGYKHGGYTDLVYITYSAIDGFGDSVQQQHTCAFIDDTRVELTAKGLLAVPLPL